MLFIDFILSNNFSQFRNGTYGTNLFVLSKLDMVIFNNALLRVKAQKEGHLFKSFHINSLYSLCPGNMAKKTFHIIQICWYLFFFVQPAFTQVVQTLSNVLVTEPSVVVFCPIWQFGPSTTNLSHVDFRLHRNPHNPSNLMEGSFFTSWMCFPQSDEDCPIKAL